MKIMIPYDTERPLIDFPANIGDSPITIKSACESIFLAGSTGSGKSSGVCRYLAQRLMHFGMGGLVLCCKNDEAETWQTYAKNVGREKDLVIIKPFNQGGKYQFDFIKYEAGETGEFITEQIIETLLAVLEASNERDSGKGEDPFWLNSTEMLITNLVDLAKLAYGTVSVELLYNLAQGIPKADDEGDNNGNQPGSKAFKDAFAMARKKVELAIDNYISTLAPRRKNELQAMDDIEEVLIESVQEARLLKMVDQFFYDNYIRLSSKTRSVIDITVSSFFFRFLREPMRSLFCSGRINIRPEDCLNGKIIVIDLPIKVYGKAGRDAQILFKYIFKKAMERRNLLENDTPCFLFLDEGQFFLDKTDFLFQATARSSRIITVFATQTLPSMYASMAGDKVEYKVKAFLANFGTKIFAGNNCFVTNEYSATLIGQDFFEDVSKSNTTSDTFSSTVSKSHKLDYLVRPSQFTKLKNGGASNNFKIEAYIFRQGRPIFNGYNHAKLAFNQNYIP